MGRDSRNQIALFVKRPIATMATVNKGAPLWVFINKHVVVLRQFNINQVLPSTDLAGGMIHRPAPYVNIWGKGIGGEGGEPFKKQHSKEQTAKKISRQTSSRSPDMNANQSRSVCVCGRQARGAGSACRIRVLVI